MSEAEFGLRQGLLVNEREWGEWRGLEEWGGRRGERGRTRSSAMGMWNERVGVGGEVERRGGGVREETNGCDKRENERGDEEEEEEKTEQKAKK